MNNNLTSTNQNAKLALAKSKSLLDITNKLLSKRDIVQPVDICQYKPFLIDKGHTSCINTILITPDSRFILSGSSDKTIKIWDIQNGECLNTLEGHSDSINSISITSNNKYIISGSSDKTIKIWDIQNGECLNTLEGHSDSINSISITSNNKYIISGSSDKTIKIWDIQNGECLNTLEGHSDSINSISITSNNKYIISGSSDKTIRIWDIQNGECLNTFKEFSSKFVEISPDGKYIISVDSIDDEIIEIFDIQSRKSLIGIYISEGEEEWDEAGVPCTYSVNSIAISPDGNYIISGNSNHTIKIYDINGGNLIKTFECYIDDDVLQNNHISTVSINPVGNSIVYGTFDGTIEIMDIKYGEKICYLSSHRSWVTSLAISPYGDTIVSGNSYGAIKTWDIQTKRKIESFNLNLARPDPISLVEFMKGDSRRIISHHSGTYTTSIWDIQKGEYLESFAAEWIGKASTTICDDEVNIVLGDDLKTIKILDNQRGECLRTLEGHSKQITSVAISPDGKYIISGSSDDTLRIWDKNSGKCICTIDNSYDIAIDKDGYFIAEDHCVEKYIRIREKSLTQRKLTKEEIKRFVINNIVSEVNENEEMPF